MYVINLFYKVLLKLLWKNMIILLMWVNKRVKVVCLMVNV